MTRELQPPLLARFLARIVIPRQIRDEMEGDLIEGYAVKVVNTGKQAADRWYWHQVLSIRPVALRKALRAGGPVRSHSQEAGRNAGGWGLDIKQGWRHLRRRPGASVTVAATIALAVAATTTVFSVVNGVLLRPLPYPESDRLVQIFRTNEEWAESTNVVLREWAHKLPVPRSTFNHWPSESREFEALGAYTREQHVFHGYDSTEFVNVAGVSSKLFQVLGIQPVMGTGFPPESDSTGAEPAVVLSYGCWMGRFGGDPQILGSALVLGSTSFTVAGVMPAEFAYPTPNEEFWVPLSGFDSEGDRMGIDVSVIGRLREGVSLVAAQAWMEAVQAGLSAASPEETERRGVRLVYLLESLVGKVETTLWFLMGSVSLALLVACVNITNVLSVLGMSRRQETALKAAMGAGSGRLARGQMLESLLLAGTGGLIGLGLSALILPTLVALLPPEIPRQENVGIDSTVLAFSLGLMLLTALLAGLYPAVQSWLTQPGSLLAGSGRTQTVGRKAGRTRSVFLVSEVSLAVVLLVGAGLLVNSFTRLWIVDRGFATEGLVTMSILPNPDRFPEPEARNRFIRDLKAELSSIPELTITATNVVPLSRSTSIRNHILENATTEEKVPFVFNVILENYFQTMGIPLVDGRGFNAGDVRDAQPVAVVNQAAAEAFWPGESAVGKRLRRNEDHPWITIVGVVRNVRHQSLDVEPEPHLYLPVEQSDVFPTEWVVRAGGYLSSIPPLLRAGLRAISPETPVQRMFILEEEISRSLAVPRFRTLFVCSLAGMAASLALLGIYGIVSFSVSQRAREIGIRIAVGSAPGQAVRLILRSGFGLALIGLSVGLLIAFPSATLLSEFLFQIRPTDPLTFLATSLLAGLVSLGAAYLPARRAARVNPVDVLKVE